jgi:hypothetical protein
MRSIKNRSIYIIIYIIVAFNKRTREGKLFITSPSSYRFFLIQKIYV